MIVYILSILKFASIVSQKISAANDKGKIAQQGLLW